MKTSAILIERYGPPEAFVEREVELPELGASDVHLRVEAVGVNFADLAMRAGLYGTTPPRPYSPGFEIAGEVMRVGTGVTQWNVGDKVVALIRHGGYARDVVTHVRHLFPRPPALSAVEAAAVPVVFLTAWVCLFEAARAREGETTLILGAGGGVGTAAVQLAVTRGLTAIGTAGTEAKRRFVTEQLGAAACFDSRGEWEPDVRGFVGERGIDVALDPVGGKATDACRRLLAPLGRLIFYGMSEAMPGRRRNWLRAVAAWLRTPRFHPMSFIEPNIGLFGVHLLHLEGKESVLPPALTEIYREITDGRLRPVLDRTFSLNRAGAVEAHHYLHSRRNLGKVVLAAED